MGMVSDGIYELVLGTTVFWVAATMLQSALLYGSVRICWLIIVPN
jgi:hypothetical protein